jgi:hypothetical protein
MSYGSGPYGATPYGGTSTSTPPIPPGPPVVLSPLCIFETPHVKDESPWLDDSTMRQKMLMRHYENRSRGVNVWQRSDETFCVDTPCNYESAMTHLAAAFSDDFVGPDGTATDFPALSDTAINYPWDPFPGAGNSDVPGAYAFITNWDHSTQLFALDPYLAEWFPGGHLIPITQQQALELTAAGFGDCIT